MTHRRQTWRIVTNEGMCCWRSNHHRHLEQREIDVGVSRREGDIPTRWRWYQATVSVILGKQMKNDSDRTSLIDDGIEHGMAPW